MGIVVLDAMVISVRIVGLEKKLKKLPPIFLKFYRRSHEQRNAECAK